MIKYLGSKRVLIPALLEIIGGLSEVRSVIDLFSGTSRVGHALKREGYRVLSNDLNTYAATLARCYVATDDARADEAQTLLDELASVPGAEGYFTQTFCRDARFFQPHNGMRVDAIRQEIAERTLDPELEAVALTSLMEAADRVDSTTGLQMAYLKQWARRSFNQLELRLPELLGRATEGKGEAHQLEAGLAVRHLSADLAYVDPPYNQHKYLGNYHIWETLVRWDAPEAYGIARKRVDCRERKSAFNSKPRIRAALADVIEHLDVRHLVVSFNDEGHVGTDELVEMLSTRGEVAVHTFDARRYVGARIGIHDPSGRKVGTVGRLRNRELIFVVTSS